MERISENRGGASFDYAQDVARTPVFGLLLFRDLLIILIQNAPAS
jgi:hypothetical protein